MWAQGLYISKSDTDNAMIWKRYACYLSILCCRIVETNYKNFKLGRCGIFSKEVFVFNCITRMLPDPVPAVTFFNCVTYEFLVSILSFCGSFSLLCMRRSSSRTWPIISTSCYISFFWHRISSGVPLGIFFLCPIHRPRLTTVSRGYTPYTRARKRQTLRFRNRRRVFTNDLREFTTIPPAQSLH